VVSLYQDSDGNYVLIADYKDKHIGLVSPGTDCFSNDVHKLAARDIPFDYEYLDELGALQYTTFHKDAQIAELHGDTIDYYPDGEVPDYIR